MKKNERDYGFETPMRRMSRMPHNKIKNKRKTVERNTERRQQQHRQRHQNVCVYTVHRYIDFNIIQSLSALSNSHLILFTLWNGHGEIYRASAHSAHGSIGFIDINAQRKNIRFQLRM